MGTGRKEQHAFYRIERTFLLLPRRRSSSRTTAVFTGYRALNYPYEDDENNVVAEWTRRFFCQQYFVFSLHTGNSSP